jgi:tRNA pseudouridine38-40 synthase
MVRSLAGTLVDIGRGRIGGGMAGLIACRDRSRAGQTAPAGGLVLENVFYPGVD